MAEEAGKAVSWLKYGCFGCLGVIAFVVVVGGAVVGLAWRQGKAMKPEETVLSRDLSAAESAPLSPGALAADMPEAGSKAITPPVGHVVLDLSAGEFRIHPAAPGEPMRVEGHFDPRYYKLDESYEEGEGGAFTYRVRFGRTQGAGGWLTTLAEVLSGSHSRRVEVYLPRDVLMDLDMTFSKGGVQADLGGLWLRSAGIDMSMGGAQIDFKEPLKAPMESLTIDGKMGGGAFGSLGNASPGKLIVGFSMGGLNLDLGGAWSQDGAVDVSAHMGGVSIRLPRNVNLKGLDPDVKVPAAAPGPDAPTLTFSIHVPKRDLQIY